MLIWAGWAARVAWHELSADYTVRGLTRSYQAPYQGPDGWVMDPRPGEATAELFARFDLGPAPTPPPKDLAQWSAALTTAGVRVRPVRSHWDGLRPRVRVTGDRTWLLLGAFGRRGVVFDPQRGVVLLDGEAPPGADLELLDRRERPW